MTKKHIDVISKYFWPANAGIEVNIKETYKILADMWDITLHTSTDTLTESDVLSVREKILGMDIRRYKFGKFGYWPRIDWDTTDLVCFHNFNVFYVFIMLYILVLKVVGRKKFGVIVTPHGGFTPEWSIYPKSMVWIKKTYHFTLGAVLLNLVADKIRAVSEWERHEIIKHGVRKDKVVTISNGLEDEAFADLEKLASPEIKKKVKDFGRYIIQVGRIYIIKNYETTIKALKNVPPDVKYVIAGGVEGNSEYLEGLKKLIRESGLSDRVVFFGIVRGIDKFYLMKHAQMMVHMALWESFCNVVHEGMSQGLVCLVANNTALPLLIKDGVNGYCIGTRDDKDLAKKINYVLENKKSKKIQDMERLNTHIGLDVSWASVSAKMNALYEQEVHKYVK